MEAEVLEFINKTIHSEKGVNVQVGQKLIDAELDSFGITVLFMDLDTEYQYFKDVPDDVDPFTLIDFQHITIKEMVDQCLLNRTNI